MEVPPGLDCSLRRFQLNILKLLGCFSEGVCSWCIREYTCSFMSSIRWPQEYFCHYSFFHLYFIEGKSVGEVLSVCDVNWRELLKWTVPGLLYFCDNLIGFYILLHLSAVSISIVQNLPELAYFAIVSRHAEE